MRVEFDPEFLKKLEYLYVVSRKVFAGQMRADRRSKKVGAGVEFADHRDYAPGDDLRYLDWSVYARLDRLLLRLFHEEEDLHIYFLLDVSRSMTLERKLEYAEKVCAALGYVGLSTLDRISIVPFGGTAREPLPPARGRGNIFKMLRFLQAIEPGGDTHLCKALEAFVHRTKRRGVCIVLSDFFDEYRQGLDLLRFHRFEPTVLHIYAPKEARPTLRGDVELVDCESGDSREVTVSERVLDKFAAAFAAHTEELERYCRERAIPYYRADTSVPFDELILRIFRAGGFLA
jgi:uncharacterized protein (DUF58 family)